MKTFAQHVLQFLSKLHFDGELPQGISIMNPFKENKSIPALAKQFYEKYYSDTNQRTLVLGINPGRLGAGATGIPFTDTVRMQSHCGIVVEGLKTHEPSSVFVYEMIDAFGGPELFYSRFYISSICPLGFTKTSNNGKEINYNYYDSKELTKAVESFMVDSIEKQLKFGINRKVCFCFGTGKNFEFISKLNAEQGWFKLIVPLEHPRYIMQYKSRFKADYIEKYLRAFSLDVKK
jgi:hypothetical protein